MRHALGQAILAATLIACFSGNDLFAQGPPLPLPVRPGASFESGVDLVALDVTVTDQRQNYVENLTRSDFIVRDEGVPQDIIVFEPGAVPVDLALLIDVSGSVRAEFRTIRRAALQVLDSLGPQDRAAIIGFNDRIRTLVDWTGDRRELEHAVETLTTRGGTSLYSAIYVTLKDFGARTDRDGSPRRRAIVVLSDGDDTTSLLSFEDLLDSCRRAGVAVYTVRVARQMEASLEVLSKRGHRRSAFEYAMATLARETGARHFSIRAMRDLPNVFTTVARELAHQYVVGFAPSSAGRDGAFCQVTVSVPGRRDLVVRTRPGYVRGAPSRLASLSTPSSR